MDNDPSKPLKNRRHELLIKKVLENPKIDQQDAYLEIFPTDNPKTAQAQSSMLLNSKPVRERMMYLFDKHKASLDDTAEIISKHMRGDNAPVSMDACKTILKVAGAMDEAERKESSFNPTQIIINIMPDAERKDNDSI
jgi:hypothetical protein